MNNMIKNKGTTGRREKRSVAAPNSRHVTFSKRRVGLFKMASELCAVTGAECAILCESVGGRVFAFGHPSVESVVDKYLGDETTSSELPENTALCMHEELKKQYLEIAKEIEIEKNKSVKLMGRRNDDRFNISNDMEKGGLFWWQQPFDHLGVEELDDYISSMEELKNNLNSRADDLNVIKSSSSSIFGADHKALNSNDGGLSDESLAIKILATKDIDGQPADDEFLMSKMNFSDHGQLDEELHEFFNNNYQLRDNNVLVDDEVPLPRNSGNFVVPDDNGRDVDLHKFDDFSFGFPPNY